MKKLQKLIAAALIIIFMFNSTVVTNTYPIIENKVYAENEYQHYTGTEESNPATVASEVYSDKSAIVNKIEYLTLDSDEYDMLIGESTSTVVGAVYADGSTCVLTEDVIYQTAENSIAMVSREGVLNAVGTGETTLTASYKGLTAISKIKVTSKRLSPPVLSLSEESGKIVLSWTGDKNSEFYLIKKGTSPYKLEEIASEIKDTQFIDSDVINGFEYYYAVVAVNKGIESSDSNIVVNRQITLEAPILYGMRKQESIRLNWTVKNNEVKYELYRSENSGGPYELVSCEEKQKQYVDKDVNDDRTYYYVVKAVDKQANESNYSNEIKIEPSIKPTKFDPDKDDDQDGISNEEELFQATDIKSDHNDLSRINNSIKAKKSKTEPLKKEQKKNKNIKSESMPQNNQNGNGKNTKSKGKAGDKRVKRQVKAYNGRIAVDVTGYEDLENAPLTAEEIDDEYLNTLKGIVGTPVEIDAGGTEIENATISITYDKKDLKGTGEDNLTIYWVDKDNARLVPLDNHKIDKAKGIVSADTPHFSTYILGDNTILGQSIIPGSLFNTDIIFAVDRSYNMGIKDADKYRYKLIETFVNNMNELNAGTDKLKIALVDFSEFAQRKESLTSDATVLAQKLAGMKAVIPGGSTNIAESLWIPRFMFSQRTGKKLLVILTDGKDTSGNLRQGIEKIAESLDPKIMVNTVAVGNDTDSELLRNMASITGGAYFTLNTSDEVQANQDIEEIYRKIIKQTVIQDMTEPPDELDDAVIKLMLNSEDNRGLDNEEALRLYALKTNANILTGNYVENATDISIGNITGMNISLGRTYNSDAANESTAIGNGWRLNYDSNIKIKDNIGIVTANGLNLRTQPVSNLETNNIITVLSRNKTVEFLDTQPQTVGGIQWRKVKVFDGTASYEGYVACTYIKTITTGAEVTYGSGTKAVFQAILNGQGNVTGYEPVFGVHDKLNKTASGFEVVRKDQTKYTYNTYDSINAVYRLSSIADRNGNKLEMYYDPTKEKLLEVTDPVGRTIALVYNDDDKLTKVFDTSGRCVEYSYDEKGNLLTVRYPGGNKTTYKYKECREATRDGNNYSYVNAYRLSSITDANGHTALRNEYDVFGRLVKQYDANNNVRYQIYKDVYRYENGDIASSNSELARYYIDENGYESKILLNPITNKIKSETDVLGQTTEYSYQMDYKGNGTGWTDISNLDFDTEAQNSLYYSAISTGNKPERITIKDKNGYSTQYEYDERGNTLSIKDIGLTQNNTVTMEYDSNNNLTQKTDRKNNTTTYTYIDNKLNTVEDPYGNTTTYTYSDCELSTGMTAYGLLSTETQRRKASSGNLIEFKTTGYNYQYDNVNEVETIKTTDTLNNVHTTRYDKLGRVFMITDANGHATRYYYDVAGRFTREVDHLGYATEIKYDGAGNKRFVTDKNFNTTEYIYDDVNQLIKVIDPQGNSKTFKYDASGKKIEEINESGAELQYEYDALGRLYQVIDPLGNTTTYAEYDGNGNVRKVLDSLNRLTEYQYDRYNRRIKEIMPLGMINQYSYDAASNLEQFTDPDGKITKYEYDSLNRKVRVTDGYNPNYPKDTSGIYSGPFDAETGELVGNIETTLSYDVYVSEGKKIEKITQTNPMGHSTVEEYDALGRLIKVTDPDSNYASYQYDAVGNLKTETDKRGYTTTYSYDELDRLVRITDPLGNSIAKGYDPSGNLILETDKKGRNTEYGYDKNNRLLAKTDALGNMTAYTYDKAGNLKTVKDPCANTTTYYYDKLNRLTAEKDPEGNMKYYGYDNVGNKIYQSDKIEYSSYDAFAWPVETENGTIYRALTMYKYDELGRLVKVYDTENNLIQENGYDIAGNLVSQKDANGNIVEYEYNALNRLKKTIYPGDGTIYSNTITYMYDPAGNLKEETDSTGTVIKYNYDNLYRLIKKTQEGQNGEYPIELNWIYDQNGNKIYEKDGNEVATQYGYDALGRLVTTNTAGKTTSYSYDSNDNLIEENDWRNNKYIKIYDELNRLIEEKDPYGKTIRRLKYYANSLTKESYDALNYMTRFEYDKNGSLIKTTDPEGNIVKQVYDANGSLIQKYDGKNNKTTYTYDHLNRLEYILDAEGTITSYTYDNNGNMLTQTDGRGNITTYEYNAANKVTKRIDHGGMNDNTKTQSYTYNADGSLKTKVDRNGKTATYTYDVHGRLKKQTVGSIITDYTYDNNGNQLEIRTGAETTVRTYDAFNRVISKTVTNIGTSTYEYDIISSVEAGCVKENSLDPKGNSVTKVYDRVGRLKEVTSEGKTTTYTYNDNGSRKSSVYFDGSREDYTYYRNGLLHTLVNRKADGTVIDNYSYTYDKSGNQTTKTDNKGITWYTYDSLNRLETVTEPDGRLTEYTYDGAGNRATEKVAYQGDISLTTYSYNEQNRLVSSTVKLNAVTVEKRNYEYDYNGNQLTVTKIPYDNGVPQPQQILATNTYDDLNQLIQTETYNGNTSTTTVNIYNGEGLRVGKNVNGTLTRYLYEYQSVVLEVDGNRNEVARNIYGTNLLMRTVNENGTDSSYYYMYNGHADVTALINTVTSSIDATYYYDAFGNITESTGSVNNNITYAGYQYDEETGLYYLNARHYDPKIARFLQEDTYLGDPNDPLSLNLYTYCHNEPLRYYDPDGHESVEIGSGYIIIRDSSGKTIYEAQNEDYTYKKNNSKSLFPDFSWLVGAILGTKLLENSASEAAQSYIDKLMVEEFEKAMFAEKAGKTATVFGTASTVKLVASVLPFLLLTGDTQRDIKNYDIKLPPGFVEINGHAWSSITGCVSPATAWDIYNASGVQDVKQGKRLNKYNIIFFNDLTSSFFKPKNSSTWETPGNLESKYSYNLESKYILDIRNQLTTDDTGVGGGQKLLPAGQPKNFIRNKMGKEEISFAQEILDLRGGTLEGNLVKMDAPAIDGTLNGNPIQIKDLTSSGSLQKLLKHASKAEAKAKAYNYNGLELYMNAPGFSKSQIIDFAKNGPLSKIPSQGTIDSIYIKANDGWMIIK